MNELLKGFFGVPKGEIYPRVIAAGQVCPDNLIAAAREAGALPAVEENGSGGSDTETPSDGKQSEAEADKTEEAGGANTVEAGAEAGTTKQSEPADKATVKKTSGGTASK